MSDTSQVPPGGQITAKYANFFSITATQTIVRVSFAESFGSEATAQYHTAIALGPKDAENLGKFLLQVVAQSQLQPGGTKEGA
jgi:hypothetical protein